MNTINRNELIKYIRFACEHKCTLAILGASGKTSIIYIDSYEADSLSGHFSSSGDQMKFYFKNIVSCSLPSKEDQNLFIKEQFLESCENPKDAERQIASYQDYYRQVIPMSKRTKQSDSSDDVDFSEKSIEHYDLMFQHIYEDKDGLFAGYLLSRPVNENVTLDTLPILLLSRSNYSQKIAIESALRDRVSIIEGPPGTGKTTTILSIIANLVVRGKRVAVISKNNSAIDNVKEELDKLNLPPFYLRFGSKTKVMEPLAKTIKVLVTDTAKQAEQLQEPQDQVDTLSSLYRELKSIEEDINRLVIIKNRMQENENQLRHLEKRDDAFKENLELRQLRRLNRSRSSALRREIDRIAGALQRFDDQSTISFWDRLINRFRWGFTTDEFYTNGLLLQFRLEHIYLTREIEELSAQLNMAHLREKQDDLERRYNEQYITASLAALGNFLSSHSRRGEYLDAVKSVLSYTGDNVLYDTRQALRQIYPVILTTADALVYNFKDLLQSGGKLDYIIMDEASQCDLIAGLPMLSLADRCVIVGDQKQLSAIINAPSSPPPEIDEAHDYFQQTFLSSVQKVWAIKPTLLQEHYRCDYAIINYCNKFFYNRDLIIYTEANPHAMKLLTVDQGKYADMTGASFYNEREIKSIEGITGSNLHASYVITPFKGQGEKLRTHFRCKEGVCGTIHTFQGRGEETVYFSTVLNDLPFANGHLKGDHCLFTKELVNVAVSRAKKHFILVSDREYLRKNNTEMQNLIDYIETYGESIPDKTVCIFDHLYQLMKSYTQIGHVDNIFEQKVYNLLLDYCQDHPQYHFFVKLPLADLVTDKTYLEGNTDIRRFVLHWNTHVDFTLFNPIGNPVLAIELDGKHHQKADQMERDLKKDAALKHMGIPLWRLLSKSALSKEEFIVHLDSLMLI